MKNLRVFYGFAKLTPKIVRKQQLIVMYENENFNVFGNDKWVNQKIHIIYERKQTRGEKKDAIFSNRMFTKYGYFIEDENFKGNIERVLENNFLADQKNVDVKTRKIIRDLLRKSYFEVYNAAKYVQSALIFS